MKVIRETLTAAKPNWCPELIFRGSNGRAGQEWVKRP